MAERWITWKGRHILVGDDGSIIKNNKKYIGKEYTSENVNDFFKNIENYNQFEEFRDDYRKKIKFNPYIVSKRNPTRQWVAFIEKIDNDNISFSVLSYDRPYSRKTKSSIKNFVKNYKVHQE